MTGRTSPDSTSGQTFCSSDAAMRALLSTLWGLSVDPTMESLLRIRELRSIWHFDPSRKAIWANLPQPERREVALHVAATHHVEHDIDALAPGQLLRHADKILAPIVDRPLGPEPLARSAFFRRSGGRKHANAERGGNLDRSRTYAAAAAVDEQPLAGPKPGALEEIGPYREAVSGRPAASAIESAAGTGSVCVSGATQ